ncbi:carboxypeptidase-like regulatory domain-containing protein [uncultured Jatrophihabitans sp.]|uniref:carboxypeptidase-like regulatory domain-containing protein n=1 Tax=uncultured Jatrophihabitans sp. TaxID=1610747 RepID=UPI0035C9C0DB
MLIIAGAALAIAHRAGTSRPASGANQAVITGTLRLAGGAPSLNLTGKGAIPGTVFVYGSATYEGPPITSVTTNSKGRYRVRLPPGIYYLAATSPRYRINPRPQDRLCQTGPVNATAGTTKKDVECNMK